MPLFRWVKVVFAQWVAEVTGGVIVGVLALYSELSANIIQPRVYEVVVVLALFQAMFLAWHKEETSKLYAESRISKLEIEKPDFISSLAIILAADNPQMTSLFADLTVINQGKKASIIKNLRFSYVGPTGKKHHIVHVPINLAFTPNQGIERIGNPLADDSGIPPGGRRVISDRYFVSYPIEEITKGGLMVELSFSDIDNKPYTVSAEIGRFHPPENKSN